jgi:hypothetical protein
MCVSMRRRFIKSCLNPKLFMNWNEEDLMGRLSTSMPRDLVHAYAQESNTHMMCKCTRAHTPHTCCEVTMCTCTNTSANNGTNTADTHKQKHGYLQKQTQYTHKDNHTDENADTQTQTQAHTHTPPHCAHTLTSSGYACRTRVHVGAYQG